MRSEVIDDGVASIRIPAENLEKLTPKDSAALLLGRKLPSRSVTGLHVYRNDCPVRIMLLRSFDVGFDLIRVLMCFHLVLD